MPDNAAKMIVTLDITEPDGTTMEPIQFEPTEMTLLNGTQEAGGYLHPTGARLYMFAVGPTSGQVRAGMEAAEAAFRQAGMPNVH